MSWQRSDNNISLLGSLSLPDKSGLGTQSSRDLTPVSSRQGGAELIINNCLSSLHCTARWKYLDVRKRAKLIIISLVA